MADISTLEARITHSEDLCDKAQAMTELAWALSALPDGNARARALAEETFVLCRHHDTCPQAQAQALIVAANLHRIEGLYELAITHVRLALNTQERLNIQDMWTARGWFIIARCYRHLGDYAASADAVQQQLQIAEATSDMYAKADALKSMGILASLQGDYRGALAYYQLSSQFFQQIGNVSGLAANHNNAAVEYRHLGEYAQAREQGLSALRLFEQENYPQGMARAHINLGHIATDTDALADAQHHFQQAMRLAQESGEIYTQTESLLALGRLSFLCGRAEAALQTIQEALKLAESSDDKRIQYECHELLSQIYEAQGDFERALAAYKTFHNVKAQVLNETSLAQMHNLEVRWRTDQALKSAEQERQLRAADRDYFARLNRMRDDFINAATHDLKNPLAHILLLVGMLQRHNLVLPQGQKFLERIETSANQMRQLIADLLDIAQLETGRLLNLEPQGLVALTRRVLQSFSWLAAQKAQTLDMDLPKEEIILPLDAGQFTHALENLLSNAIKYTPNGGHIHCAIRHDGQSVLITIADSGIGIPTEALPHIFERFYRVKSAPHQAIEGTGLGLYIVKTVVEQHGGRIWAESAVGSGTTFFIGLPYSA